MADNDANDSQGIRRVRSQSIHHQANPFHLSVSPFRETHRSFLEIPYDFGLPATLLANDPRHERKQAVRLERTATDAHGRTTYRIMVRLCNTNNVRVRYWVEVSYEGESVLSTKDEFAGVDAESWLVLGPFAIGGLEGIKDEDILEVSLRLTVVQETVHGAPDEHDDKHVNALPKYLLVIAASAVGVLFQFYIKGRRTFGNYG